jgi:hypothetical protein
MAGRVSEKTKSLSVLYNPADPTECYVNAFLHASNAVLSGSPQQGADNPFLWLEPDGSTVDPWLSSTGGA